MIEYSFLANLIMGGLEEGRRVQGLIKSDDFIDSECAKLFRIIMEKVKKGEKFDVAILSSVADPKFLAKIIGDWYNNPGMQSEYIRLLQEQRILREIGDSVSEFLENPEGMGIMGFFEELNKIKSRMGVEGNDLSFVEAMKKVIESAEGKEGAEFQFDLIDMNRWIGGLARGELMVIGGFTSHCKSSLVVQMGIEQAERGKKVLLCSSEMSNLEVARRVLSNYCQVGVIDLRRGFVGEEQIQTMKDAMEVLSGLKIGIVLVNHVRQIQKAVLEAKPDIVIVDHLHNLKGYGSSYERTTQSIKTLKEIALTDQVGMVVVSQMHRPKDDKARRPQITDLRESGGIEETANNILLLYWENKAKNKPIGEFEKVEARVVKNRDGLVGKFDLLFETKYCRFLNQSREEE